jgi:hypothetical protein
VAAGDAVEFLQRPDRALDRGPSLIPCLEGEEDDVFLVDRQ